MPGRPSRQQVSRLRIRGFGAAVLGKASASPQGQEKGAGRPELPPPVPASDPQGPARPV